MTKLHGLPDPEMRKFLVLGDVDKVKYCLIPHCSQGLKITMLTPESCTVKFLSKELTFKTDQRMKETIREVNNMMEEATREIKAGNT